MTFSYDRAENLKANDYGFEIQVNGEFLEQANSGRCGTPPISYSDYNGKWSLQDSILDITVAFWGGTVHYKWKVLSVDKEKLSLSVIETEYEYKNEPHKKRISQKMKSFFNMLWTITSKLYFTIGSSAEYLLLRPNQLHPPRLDPWRA